MGFNKASTAIALLLAAGASIAGEVNYDYTGHIKYRSLLTSYPSDSFFQDFTESDSFLHSLCSWSPSGFSVYADQRIPPHDIKQLEHLARYIARPPIQLDSVELLDDGRVCVTTSPDPRDFQDSATTRPAPPSTDTPTAPDDNGDIDDSEHANFLKARRRSWARPVLRSRRSRRLEGLLRRIFEVDVDETHAAE